MELRGITAIITGGGSGFGKGIAAALSASGAKVWITGRNGDKLAAAAEEIGAQAFVADASDGGAWDRLLSKVGDVDLLVNNAGFGGKIAPLAEQEDSDIGAVIATNLTGAIIGASRVSRIMAKRRRGIIVNISSVCALHAWPGWSVYTAAKAGLLKFSHALHTEMRPYGVRVVCLIPSWGQTDFNRASGIPEPFDDLKSSKDLISPSQLGKIVSDLVSMPDHLTVPELVVQPMIQEIIPM